MIPATNAGTVAAGRALLQRGRLVLQVPREPLAGLAQLDPRAHLGLVRLAPQGLQEPRATLDRLARLVPQGPLGRRVTRARLVRLVLLARLAQRVPRALRARQGLRGQQERLELRAHRAMLVPQVLRARLAPLARRELRVTLGRLGLLARRVRRGQLVPKAMLGPLARQVLQELRVRLVPRVQRDQRGLPWSLMSKHSRLRVLAPGLNPRLVHMSVSRYGELAAAAAQESQADQARVVVVVDTPRSGSPLPLLLALNPSLLPLVAQAALVVPTTVILVVTPPSVLLARSSLVLEVGEVATTLAAVAVVAEVVQSLLAQLALV